MNYKEQMGIVILFLTFIILVLVIIKIDSPQIDLPEEYELITPNTPIQGTYKDGTLIIEFKH